MVTMTGMYMDRTAYNIKKSVRDWFRELLEMLFQAAGLIIDTLRTLSLIHILGRNEAELATAAVPAGTGDTSEEHEAFDMNDFLSVSYTHLDVYKRQRTYLA